MPTEFECRYNLFDTYTAFPTGPILFTLSILFLTVVLEITAHKNFSGAADRPYATLHTRATRLAIACLLYPLLLTCFVLRIVNAQAYARRTSACREWVAGPFWPTIWILNVFPLACATCAFLRTLVDCVLSRWGRGLRNVLSRERREGTVWVPVLPVSGVVVGVLAVFEGVKGGIGWAMGREGFGEEGVGLVEGVEGDWEGGEGEGDGRDEDGLPECEEVVGAEDFGAGDGRGKGDELV
ncbi:hypothetical protein HBH47_095560 [Parastagonospora nodorum]|nr:hypothetical protein HBH47_095560 [Parastagonospora nodorum]